MSHIAITADNLAASSILELLTYPNPAVSHNEPRNKTNTRGLLYHYPTQLKIWKEFDNFKILRASFAGALLREARMEGRKLPHYPAVHPEVDCLITDENDTRDLIHKWNKSIVTAALDPILHDFHPVIWRRGDPPSTNEASEPPPRPKGERAQPPRRSSSQAKKPKMQSIWKLKSDSGSVSRDLPSPGAESTGISFRKERFPKEYKPATKWTSGHIVERQLVNEFGEWEKGKLNDNYAMPIRQAYTYCVQHMCRYGCILTCQEAFIFRVKPRDGEPVEGSRDPKLLRKGLIENGLMEYISIPWTNHRQGDVRSHRIWTVNLALWFVHILAGNSYEAGWTYKSLADERLAVLTPLGRRNHIAPEVMNECGDESSRREEEEAEDDDDDDDDDEEEEEEEDDDDDDDDDEDDDEESGSSDSGQSEKTVSSPARKRKRDSHREEYDLSFTKRQFGER